MRRILFSCLFRSLLIALCILQASCAHRQRIRSQSGPLAESLQFVEQDRHGISHTLGHGEGASPGKVGIPAPGLVDIDSLIDIGIDKSTLTTDQQQRLDRGLAQEMQAEHTLLKKVIEQLGMIATAKQRYVETYTELIRIRLKNNVAPGETEALILNDPNGLLAKTHQAWILAWEELDALESEILKSLDEMYGERDPDFAELVGSTIEKDPQGLCEALKSRLQKVNDEQERWLEPLAEVSPSLTLELEASLISGSKRAQVHLPNYDQLDEGEVERRHNSALNLSSEDRQEIEAQWRSTVELSHALESYRRGTDSLNDLIEKTKPIVAPEVTALIEKAAVLHEQWEDLDPKDFADGTFADLELLANKAREEGAKVADDAITILEALPGKIRPQLESARAIEAYVDKLASMKDRAQSIKPENLPTFLFDTKDLLEEANQLLKADLSLTQKKDQDVLKTLIEEELATLYKKAEEIVIAADKAAAIKKLDAVNSLLSQPEAQRLKERLETVRDIYTGVDDLVADAKELLSLIGIQKLPQDVGTIHSYRVPLDKMTDTCIDLLKTPRQTGDRIEFRAQLYSVGIDSVANPEPIDELSASFEILKFGWHDRLSPSVVLVRPVEMDAGEENYTFAPVLSWIHNYGVRPEQDSLTANIQRFLDASIGMHASFVNFDPDKEVEIGMGLTLSFWEDRLQCGAGINLMASSTDNGRYYFFVGSDLISLLNTIGIGK